MLIPNTLCWVGRGFVGRGVWTTDGRTDGPTCRGLKFTSLERLLHNNLLKYPVADIRLRTGIELVSQLYLVEGEQTDLGRSASWQICGFLAPPSGALSWWVKYIEVPSPLATSPPLLTHRPELLTRIASARFRPSPTPFNAYKSILPVSFVVMMRGQASGPISKGSFLSPVFYYLVTNKSLSPNVRGSRLRLTNSCARK